MVTTDTVAGVIHVINTPPEAGAPVTLVGEVSLRIGTAQGEGETSFGMLRSIAVLQDGRLAVADAQAEQVRVFAPDGQFLHTFGGEGGGPGELKGMQGAYVDHDGLLRVAEQGNARLSVFDPDKGFVTSYRLRLYSYGFRGPWEASTDAVGRTFVASSGQYGAGRYWNMLRVYDSTMTQLDSIPYHEYTNEVGEGDQPGAWQIPIGDRGFTWAAVPFYAQPHETLTSGGVFLSSTEGARQLELARWTPPSDTSMIIYSRREPVPVTTTERDSAMADLVTGLSKRVRDVPKLDPSKVPSSKPPLYGLSLDEQGRPWVRLTDPTADSTVYDVFEENGEHAETVSLPFRVDAWIPPVVRADTLWAVVTDDMDVQYVVRAELHPGQRKQ